MLASLDDPPLVKRGLVYEPKYDGVRALVDLRPPARRGQPPHVALYSRNGHNKRAQFPAIVTALEALAARIGHPILADAEIVAVDRKGRPLGFGELQGRIHLTAASDIERTEREQPAVLVLFDLLRDHEEDLRGLPLAARRLRLQQVIRPRGDTAKWIRLSEVEADDGRKMLERAEREGWEGLIVKDGHSVYRSGRRTPAWRKLKLTGRQEFVVVGWTDPQGSRHHFGALLLAVHDGGRLRYVGNVGTGFDEDELARVAKLLDARARTTSPLAAVPKPLAASAHWIDPSLVAEVRFTEFTSDGMLRHPVYLGLRDDKPARQVSREHARSQGPRGPKAEGPKGRRADGVVERLLALEDARKDGDVELPNGDRLRVTNLTKLFWPSLGITKGELLRYYAEVAPLVLPAVDDRPLVMKRFPNGVEKKAFYQQRHPDPVPAGVRREMLPEDVDPIDESEGGRERLIGGSLTTLLYMTQLAAISQDPWFSRVADPLSQDYTAIDLDPGEGASFARVLDVARWVKDELDRFRIPAVPKTSGSRGLHIYIPLPPHTGYDVGQLLAEIIATLVSSSHRKVATIERMVRRRPTGTVYVDYLQNILGKTLATAYSARASDYAGVSTPLTWEEVEQGVDPRDFTIRTAPARFREVGDLWARLRTGKPVKLERVVGKRRLA
jgi:bifunctional non-homologous end joining protein LigD